MAQSLRAELADTARLEEAFSNEVQLFERLMYKNKSQHRRSIYYQKLLDVRWHHLRFWVRDICRPQVRRSCRRLDFKFLQSIAGNGTFSAQALAHLIINCEHVCYQVLLVLY